MVMIIGRFLCYVLARQRPGLPCVKGMTIPPSRLTPCHLPLHKGGFGAAQNRRSYRTPKGVWKCALYQFEKLGFVFAIDNERIRFADDLK